jgi:hypothetical protein
MPTRKFIAPQAKAGDGHGYLNRPPRPIPEGIDPVHDYRDAETVARIAAATHYCDEPEAISDDIVDAFRDLGRTYDRLRHNAEVEQREHNRQALTQAVGPLIAAEHRMNEARRRAKLQHVDVSHELHIMRRDLDRARNGGRDNPTNVIARLERLEARLDHRPDLDAA